MCRSTPTQRRSALPVGDHRAQRFYAVAWQSYGSSGNDNSDLQRPVQGLRPPRVLPSTGGRSGQQLHDERAAVPRRCSRRTAACSWPGEQRSPGNDGNGFSIQGASTRSSRREQCGGDPAVARVREAAPSSPPRRPLQPERSEPSGGRHLHAASRPRGTPRTEVVSLPANTQLSVTDPLAAWFGFSGSTPAVGSLLLELRDGGSDLLARAWSCSPTTTAASSASSSRRCAQGDAAAAGQVGYLASTSTPQVYRVTSD